MRRVNPKLDVMCQVNRVIIDIECHRGELHIPECNTPDFSRTIKLFTLIDPDIELIFVYEETSLHLVYERQGSKWVAEIITP